MITILTYLRVISAMGWLGGATLILSVISPGLRSLSPAASLEFLVKVGQNSTRFFIAVSTSTVIFGLALFFSMAGQFPGSGIYVGITLGLLSYLTAMVVAVPGFMKAERLGKEMLASGKAGPPPPEFPRALRRGGLGITIVVVLLSLAVIFMVASGVGYY